MDDPTLSELQALVVTFVDERDWRRFHTPKNLALSIAIEAAELMEHVQWLTGEEIEARLRDPAAREAVAAELADILLYALSFAEASGIDLTQAILAKLEHNRRRFPPERVGGRLGNKPGGGHDEAPPTASP
jgi:dCTP diphosphatase